MSDPSNTAQASTDAGAGQAAADKGKAGATDAQLSLLSGASAADAKGSDAKAGADAAAAKADPAADPNAKSEGDGKDGKKDDAKAAEAKVPEKYELAMPEGMQLDQAALDKATPVFKELGLNNEQANKLAAIYAEQMKSLATSQRELWTKQHEGWTKNMLSDAEYGGDGKFAIKDGRATGASVELISRAIDKVAGKESTAFREMLDITGAGNHPEMARFLYRVGKSVGEGSMIRGDAAAQGENLPQEVLYPSMQKGN